jgi:hypothetical protein
VKDWRDLKENREVRKAIQNIPDSIIREKVEQVNDDLRIIDGAIETYALWNGRLPLPDWVLSLSDEEFMNLVNKFFLSLRNYETKEQVLQHEREVFKSPQFLYNYKIFTNPFMYKSEEEKIKFLEARRKSGFVDFYKDVEGHTIDVFDKDGKVYGYSFAFSSTHTLLTSSGPDGDRDIDLTRYDTRKPNHGYDKPFITYSYDPSNGLVSDGDLFATSEIKNKSWGIYYWTFP